MNRSIGGLELRSISMGMEVSDAMIKKAQVEIIYFRSICPGKFLVLICGNEGEVKTAIDYGREFCEKYLVDGFILNAVHEDVIQAIKGKCIKQNRGAIGIIETVNVSIGLKSLDIMIKNSNVSVIQIQMAFAIGGKLVFVVSGEVSDIQNGVTYINNSIDEKKIVNISVIPAPDTEIVKLICK